LIQRIFKRVSLERYPVDRYGFIRWRQARFFVGRALRDELVELRPSGRRRRRYVTFGPVVLGLLDERHPKRPLRKVRLTKKVSAMCSVAHQMLSERLGTAIRAGLRTQRKCGETTSL
jgi:hypothetical protein